ncbi:potassium channel family protein [Virgibacillus kekensis]|uniref:Potassium channel family protein n=1 Tax=Virgibacillus kekensis TaxID=202261 RepID=A0ABV9DF03_9BACI
MDIIPAIIVFIICSIVVVSIIDFIRGGGRKKVMEMRETRFSVEIFYTLLVIYLIVIIGFGLIYFTLSINNILLVENGELRHVSVAGSIIHSLYFSGVTLLTIGYGDITPIGIGRFIALVQALLGYVLPTAFVLRLVQTNHENRDSQ